ncbi:MAG: hypothetical protein K2G11_09285 [Muribaculaceae bacterium]|nr:hypothetical protein [Muribaculaceae bacterium]
MMFGDLEGLTGLERDVENQRNSISPAQLEYINECVEGAKPSTLIDRIDEFATTTPPKGVDANPQIAELIEPVKDNIDSKYLEAPADVEQIQQIGEYLSEAPGLQYDRWKYMENWERCEVLQDAEMKIAEIEHRPYCEIKFEYMERNSLGYYDSESKTITLNTEYVNSDSPADFRELIDTLVHEGRHAYQYYNMTEREVHSRPGEVNMWKWNENEIGYQSANLYGFEAYAMQPVETDARAFAEDVINTYFEKIG